MRWMSFVCLFSVLAACGDADTELDINAKLGWVFNHADWTADSPVAELRTCDNQPDTQPLGNGPPAVAKVRVVVKDPQGQVQGYEREHDCAAGESGKRIELKGMVSQSYTLTMTAIAANGIQLYSVIREGFDLTDSEVADEQLELRSDTGDVLLYASYAAAPPQNLYCRDNVETLRLSLTEIVDRAPANEPAVVVESTECVDDFLSTPLCVYAVPSAPQPGSTGVLLGTPYEIKLEGLDSSGAVTHCTVSNDNASVKPRGFRDNPSYSVALEEGSCS